MRKKCRFWLVALAFLSVFAVAYPGQVWADPPTPSTYYAAATPEPTALCPANNPIDNAAKTNRAAWAQQLFSTVHNINSLFPIIPANGQCVQKLTNLIAQLPALNSVPSSLSSAAIGALIGTIVQGVLQSIVDSACSAVADTLSSAVNSAVNLTKICIPLPSFGGFDLPTFNSPACTGGIQISPISGGYSSNTPLVQVNLPGQFNSSGFYNLNQYFGP